MENSEQQQQQVSQQNGSTFQVKNEAIKRILNSKQKRIPRNPLEGFKQKNNFEIPIGDTPHKLIVEVYQHGINIDRFITVLRVGRSSIFFDAKISFVLAEVLKEMTDPYVPADLKPKVN